MAWVGFTLPYRLCRGTYDTYRYESLPPVAVLPEYAHVKTLEDVAAHVSILKSTLDSPTGCYLDTSAGRGVFLLDSQGCVHWSVDETGRVWANHEDVVARSLPEFLSRVRIENDIWHKTLPSWFLGEDNFDRLDLTVLSPAETAYVRHYYEGWKQ